MIRLWLQPSASWIAALCAQCIPLVTINVFTIIVFASSRHVRKRTMYLIINLAVADLLVGAVTVPLGIYFTYEMEHARRGFTWREFCILTLSTLFLRKYTSFLERASVGKISFL